MTQEKNPKKETKQMFPQIAAKAKIKGYERTADGLKIKFDKLQFSLVQQEKLNEFIDNEDEVMVTIAALQGRLD